MGQPPQIWPRMRVLFFGSPQIAADTLTSIIPLCEVVAVITNPDRKVGRGQALSYNPVKLAALAAGLRLFQPLDLGNPDLLNSWRELKPDLSIVVAYGHIMKQELLDLPKFGSFNLHYSLLPRWRGATPVQAALLAGDKVSGVSLIKMTAKMDKGGLAGRLEEDIPAGIYADQLLNKLKLRGIELLNSKLKHLPEIQLQDQDDSKALYCKKIKKEDGAVNWQDSALEIYRQWQAYTTWPGLCTMIDGKQVELVQIEIILNPSNLEPGQIKFLGKEIFIGTTKDAIKILKLKPAGRKVQDAADFSNGISALLKDQLSAKLLPN